MNSFLATYGSLATLPALVAIAATCILALVLGFRGARLPIWTLAGMAMLWGLGAPNWAWALFVTPALVLNLGPLRRVLVIAPVMGAIRRLRLLPKISDTERIAIEAGTVWVDRDLFSGTPDLRRLATETYPGLTAEEQAFLDGPVEELCRLTDDYEACRDRALPAQVWELYGKHRFFGMIIPEEYGGLGFSASANSAVLGKLASRSTQLQVPVGVTNSLGPSELLIRYGTEEQKSYYLPRLARAEEIPCFALTEPTAGSDAGSMTSHGTVFRDDDGELRLRLTWNKRYITLAPVSTLLGIAFELSDPENLLGKGTTPGITCALVSTATPGVDVGQRHDPLGPPFDNGPTTGTDVIVGIDAIIGGAEGAGRGWQMLMECLAAGRGISLPGSAAGGVKSVARVAGAYAAVRHQFGMSIGKFEGIQEPLARIAGIAYVAEAARRYTNGALDAHGQPAVITAIAKYKPDRNVTAGGDRRYGHPGRRGDHAGAAQPDRQRLGWSTGQHHGRGSQHSHPDADRVRSRSDSIAPLRLPRDRGAGSRRSHGVRRRVLRPCRWGGSKPLPHRCARADARAIGRFAGQRAGGALLPQAGLDVGDLRAASRPGDVDARRSAQAQGCADLAALPTSSRGCI